MMGWAFRNYIVGVRDAKEREGAKRKGKAASYGWRLCEAAVPTYKQNKRKEEQRKTSVFKLQDKDLD